jgi:hypothetical protein
MYPSYQPFKRSILAHLLLFLRSLITNDIGHIFCKKSLKWIISKEKKFLTSFLLHYLKAYYHYKALVYDYKQEDR